MIIGISGKKQSGKNLAAKLIKECSKKKVVCINFAYPIKRIVAMLLQIPLEQLENHTYKETRLSSKFNYHTPRELMQLIGQFGRDSISQDIWINYIFDIINNDDSTIYVITDVRYINEVERIEKAGGEVIRIERPGLICSDSHESEHDLDNYDKFSKIKQKISKSLNLGRNLSKYEEVYVRKWIEDYEYDFDIIEEGLKRSTSTTNPSIKYIDAIISSWYKKGFRTVEQINESENGKEITEKKADVKRTVSEPKRKSYQSYSQREYDSSDDFYDAI